MAAGINDIFLWTEETQSLIQLGEVRGEVSVTVALAHCNR